MYRCLRLNEILEMIFRFVLTNQFEDPLGFNRHSWYGRPISPAFLPFPRGQRSVLHLALTCRAFREPALNALWSYLRGIGPPIKSELVLSCGASPVRAHARFHPLVLRAARLQMLYTDDSLSDNAYALFVGNAPQDGFLFPKLRSLAWHDRNTTSIPALNLLLPTLNSLSLDISNALFRKAVFPGLRTAVPSLIALDFVLSVKTADGSSEIESLLLNYPEDLIKLSLRCCDISNSLLDVIAPWPRLRWLALQMGLKRIRVCAKRSAAIAKLPRTKVSYSGAECFERQISLYIGTPFNHGAEMSLSPVVLARSEINACRAIRDVEKK